MHGGLRTVMAENLGKIAGLPPRDRAELARGEIRQAPREFLPREILYRDGIAFGELPPHFPDADGEKALLLLDKRLPRPVGESRRRSRMPRCRLSSANPRA